MQRRDAIVIGICGVVVSRLEQFLHGRHIAYPRYLHDIILGRDRCRGSAGRGRRCGLARERTELHLSIEHRSRGGGLGGESDGGGGGGLGADSCWFAGHVPKDGGWNAEGARLDSRGTTEWSVAEGDRGGKARGLAVREQTEAETKKKKEKGRRSGSRQRGGVQFAQQVGYSSVCRKQSKVVIGQACRVVEPVKPWRRLEASQKAGQEPLQEEVA